jgi:drug/metabolite transporter (DMT)-like permease
LIAWGQTHLAAGLASILNAATPLFAVLVAHVFTAE